MALGMQVPPGEMIGHYRILGRIASGGMGVVYKAFDIQLERLVALKFVAPDPRCSVADREHLLREARAASNVDHKNIATIYAVEETPDGELFIAMAYYEGESLASRLISGTLQPADSINIIRQIAEGLAHAHSQGIVHRDIKPSNVILNSAGEVKIVDFGLARFTTSDATTQSLNVAGTLTYMSPEQLAGRAVDQRSDIWSLGVIAYQLLTNRLPFEEENPALLIQAILHDAPDDLGGVPKDIQLILHRALAKQVEQRYQSCTELIQDLAAIPSLKEFDVPSSNFHRKPSSRRLDIGDISSPLLRLKWLLVLFVVVAFIVGVALVIMKVKNSRFTVNNEGPVSVAAYESYEKGKQLLRRTDRRDSTDAAIEAFHATIQKDPKFALGHVGLAEAYWSKYQQTGDIKFIELAKEYTRSAFAINDQLPATHVILGRIQSGTGNKEEGIQEFQRALQLEPTYTAALLGLGVTYAELKRPREAEEALKKAISLSPEDPKGYASLGALYFELEHYDEAVESFQKIIHLVPDDASAYSSLATCHLAMGKIAEAEAEFKKSISISPNYIAYSNLGVIYFEQKRYADAAEMTKKALGITDKDYRLWYNLSLSYELLGEREEALAANHRELLLLEDLAPLQPNDPEIHSHLAIRYASLGLNQKAKLQTEVALALAPNDRDILANAGETYERLGARGQALEYLKRAIQNGSNIDKLRSDPALRKIFADPNARLILESATPTGRR